LQERLGGLDLLRLLAALMVVLFHYGYAGSARGTMSTAFPEIAGLAKYGFVGVNMFFVISGFVIAASAEGRGWLEFGIARFLRLYPAHVACMSLTGLVLVMLAEPAAVPTLWRWLANMTMLAPMFGQRFMDGAYWSIVLEIVFYGWVAALLALGVYQRWLLVIIAVWLAIAFLNESLLQWRPLRIALVTEYAGMFASGMLIWRLRAGERHPAAFALLGLALGLGALQSFEAKRVFANLYAEGVDVGVLWLLHAAIYALLLAAVWGSRWMPRAAWVLVAGGLTYPLYLVHQYAGYRVIDALAPVTGRWPAFLITFGAALLVAFLVHRFVEPAGRARLGRLLRPLAQDRRGPIGVT
jgi:peptidoglycan/LPS O-acetylase OafA/YrhL